MARRNKRVVKNRSRVHRDRVKAGRKMRARRKSRGKSPIAKKRKARATRRMTARRA